MDEYDDFDDDGSDPFGDYGGDAGFDSFGSNPFSPPRASGRNSARTPNDTASTSVAGMGLLIQGWATVTIFLTIVGMLAAGYLFSGQGMASGILILLRVSGIVIFVAAITILVGECICLAIPQQSGAKGFIIGAVAFLALQVILSLVQTFSAANAGMPFQPIPIRQGLQGAQLAFGILGLVCGLGHIICFELFLRASSQYVRRNDLAKTAMSILVGIPSCFVVIIGCSVITPWLARNVAPVIGLIMLIPMLAASIGMIVFAVMHVALLFRVGAALRN